MIIFQTAGGGDAGSFPLGGLFSDSDVPATTFRNNSYIHRLNRTLQAEMRAISAYKAAHRQLADESCDLLDKIIASHQSAGRELVNLIIFNRGIPEDRSTISIGLTRTIIGAWRAIPDPVATKATLSTLRSLERHLVSLYKRLKTEAPRRDLPVIEHLLLGTENSCSQVESCRR